MALVDQKPKIKINKTNPRGRHTKSPVTIVKSKISGNNTKSPVQIKRQFLLPGEYRRNNMFHFMKSMVMSAVMFGLVFDKHQSYELNKSVDGKHQVLWKNSHNYKHFYDDVSTPLKIILIVEYDILEMEITIDDNGKKDFNLDLILN